MNVSCTSANGRDVILARVDEFGRLGVTEAVRRVVTRALVLQ